MILWILLLSGMPGQSIEIEMGEDIQTTYPLITQSGQTHIAVDAQNRTYNSYIYIFDSKQHSIRTGHAIPVSVQVTHTEKQQQQLPKKPLFSWVVATLIILLTIRNAVDSSRAAFGSPQE